MIQQLSWSITNLFVKQQEVSEEDSEIYAFGFECILANIIQIAVLAIVGLIFNCIIELTIFSLCFTQIKKYIGGWHANTHFTCISGYTIVALIAVYLCKLSPGWISFILLGIAFGLILRLAPIQHYNNPKTAEEEKQAKKMAISTATIIAICTLGILASPFAHYAIYAACGLFVSTISLIIPNNMKRWKNNMDCI